MSRGKDENMKGKRAGEEVTRERQLAILERVKKLKGLRSHRAVALEVGIGNTSYRRLREGESQSLAEGNLMKLKGYLNVTGEEFRACLDGEISVEEVCHNLEGSDKVNDSDRSRGALEVFRDEVLPYLLIPEMLTALKYLQDRLFAWLPEYRLIRKMPDKEISELGQEYGIPNAQIQAIANRFRKVLDQSHTHDIPEYEVSLAAGDLNVDLEVAQRVKDLVLSEGEEALPKCNSIGGEG